jgi:hypothetical protein
MNLLVTCDNCGGEVIIAQDYDPDYGYSDSWRLVHASNESTFCPEEVKA